MTASDHSFAIPHSEYIIGMTDKEAVEYLLSVLETDRDTFKAKMLKVKANIGPNFPRCSLFLFLYLWERRGRCVPYEEILSNLEWLFGNYVPSVVSLQVHAKRLRRSAERYNVPITVKCDYGLGYILTCHDSNWSPFENKTNPEELVAV